MPTADLKQSDSHAPGVAPKAESLRRLYPGKKIIVGRDKLDPTKGVLPKLRAFERFLSTYPEWAHKVVLIQVTSPSPGDSSQLATKVSELVDHINAVHGTLHFQPVHHYHQTIERDEYFALLTAADCALITSTRDGMNTTSMEYILCQAEHKGTIIVSEYTGVAASLKAALKINPWDIGGVATAIKTALEMPMAERIQRHAQLHERVMSQTAAVWAAANIACLLESLQGEQATRDTPKLDVNVLQDKYKKAKKRLLLFDYDGTLTPIVKNPVDAVPPPGLIDSIKTISEDPKNIVYIISGRDGDFLDQHFGSLKNVGMSAEHGCFLRAPGEDGWLCLTDDLQMDWKRDVVEIFKCKVFGALSVATVGVLTSFVLQTTKRGPKALQSRRSWLRSHSTTATATRSLARSRPRSARPCSRACRRACPSTSSSARKTSRSVLHTPTKATSSTACSTSTPRPSSSCA